MKKTVYVYNDKRQLTNRKIVDDKYVLASNETFIATPEDQYPPYLFGEDKWTGLTLDQYKQVNGIKDLSEGEQTRPAATPPKYPTGYYVSEDPEVVEKYKKEKMGTVIFFSNGSIWLPGNGYIGKLAAKNDMPHFANGDYNHDFFTKGHDNYAEYWAGSYDGWKVLNPVNDAEKWDWSDVYFNDEQRHKEGKNYFQDRQKSVIYSYYALGYLTDYDIEHYYGAKRK